MWGEDIADPKGGVFGVTRGLTDAFPGRVENSPLAEESIVGVAQGIAIGGYKPVGERRLTTPAFPTSAAARRQRITPLPHVMAVRSGPSRTVRALPNGMRWSAPGSGDFEKT